MDFTVYILLASPQSDSDSVPAAIRAVVDQLRPVMSYKSYRVLDTIVGRGTEGDNFQSSGIVSKLSAETNFTPNYSFQARPQLTGSDQGIKLENLEFSFNATQIQRLNIATTLEMKSGQQVVVGKATLQDQALILVVMAKVVD